MPALTEFSTPIQDLLRRYPDVANIFPEYGPSDRIGMAFVSEFIAVWGQPDRTEISWWNVWPGNWPFVPQYLWYWKVPAGELQCRIDHPFYELWDKTICNCTIIKNNDGQARVFVHIVA